MLIKLNKELFDVNSFIGIMEEENHVNRKRNRSEMKKWQMCVYAGNCFKKCKV